jgi:hypothetical protein
VWEDGVCAKSRWLFKCYSRSGLGIFDIMIGLILAGGYHVITRTYIDYTSFS